MRKLLLTVLFCISGFALFAQGNLDETLGAEYYRRGEFDKAAVVYKRLFDNFPKNTFYYESYYNSMLAIKDYKTLEKELKKIIKRTDNPLNYQIDLGYVYTLEADEKDARKVFEDIVDNLRPDEEQIISTAELLEKKGQQEYALKAYLKGRKLFKNDLMFIPDIAEIYHQQKDYQKMIDEYLILLDKDPNGYDIIKKHLQEAVTEDQPFDLLRKAVLKRVQSNPDNINYSELLSWLFLQRKDFNSAFIQTKALDRKLKEGGRRLVDLARIAADYREFETAEKIYQSVLDEGRNAMYYIPAQRGLLDIKYIKVTQTGTYTDADVQSLVQSYEDFINTYGMGRPESGEVVLKLAEIKALYGNRIQEAIDLLEKFANSAASKPLIAKAKLALGDYYLLTGEVWESTLRYSQVEKMYENDPLGHEAKFRNAKLAFYNGELEWANAQLDVLKGSTSELIANDALQLSLLIQENTGMDSTERPLKMYAAADLLIFRNQFAAAEKELDSIDVVSPGNTLEDDVWMLRANMAMKKRNYDSAFTFYEKIYTKYGDDVLADDALFKAAQLQEKYLNNPAKAKDLYEKLILDYKGSVFAVEARNRFRILRGDATVN